MLKQWNHTRIVLVPKSDHTPHVSDYSPISCCTVVYKIISKVLGNRLRTVMGSLLDPVQAAYVDDHSIIENIYLAQELLRRYARKRTLSRCVLKVDLQKAFDSVDWMFLLAALQRFGFPQQFVGWIEECVTTVSYSVGINGAMYGFFKGRRGLRQGDPLLIRVVLGGLLEINPSDIATAHISLPSHVRRSKDHSLGLCG